jgi:hypothetical protein
MKNFNITELMHIWRKSLRNLWSNLLLQRTQSEKLTMNAEKIHDSKFLRKFIFKLSNCIIITLVFSSCQKVIDINLNAAAPQIVIEGSLNDQPGPYYINLSQTVNFSETNVFPPVTGALVKISDNIVTDILTEESPGRYKTSTLQGVPGRSYTLSVSANGKNYTSVSVMPAPVGIDSLNIVTTAGGFGGPRKRLEAHFLDPAGIDNFYRFAITHYVVIDHVIQYSSQQKNISITSDKFQDGHLMTYNLSGRNTLISGDSIAVELRAIDKGTYDYLRTLGQADNNAASATPANPTSNITNGALGYFSAYAVRSNGKVIP